MIEDYVKVSSPTRVAKSVSKPLEFAFAGKASQPTKGSSRETKLGSFPRTDFSAHLDGLLAKRTTQLTKQVSSEEECKTPTEMAYELSVKSDRVRRDPTELRAIGMLKGVMFKRDQPYRTRLPLQGAFSTNGSGTLNTTLSCATITSVSEWASIDALFDEFFIHSMTFKFAPINVQGAGMGYCSAGTKIGPMSPVADTQLVNSGVIMASLFNGAPTYSTASAMNANSTLALHHSGKSWSYAWRNNQKFEQRGYCLSTSGWQGWMQIANATSYGGQLQFRALNDPTFADGATVINMGYYLAFYDVSFRART
jgi:hypothetical protein